MSPNKSQRGKILSKIEETVSKKFYDPAFNESAWRSLVNEHRESVVNAESTELFERAVGEMLTQFSPKTLGLLSCRTPINPRSAINASFNIQRLSDGLRWVFQDILPGGVAAKA